MCDLIKTGKFDESNTKYCEASADLRDLISGCLHVDFNTRLTVE